VVARDGVEPPTPAFSDLVQPEPTTTYRFAGDCQIPANTCKPVQSWAAIMGWVNAQPLGPIPLAGHFWHTQITLVAMLAQLPLCCVEKKPFRHREVPDNRGTQVFVWWRRYTRDQSTAGAL